MSAGPAPDGPDTGPDRPEGHEESPAVQESGEAPAVQGPPADADSVARLEDRLRRALADLDTRELDRERAAERARSAAEWLPVVDNLELALQHAHSDPGAVIEGVRAVHGQAVSVLDRLGFPRFDAAGEPFDPAVHEAVGTVRGDSPEGTVVAVVRPGYGTAGSLLRPAGVVVAKG